MGGTFTDDSSEVTCQKCQSILAKCTEMLAEATENILAKATENILSPCTHPDTDSVSRVPNDLVFCVHCGELVTV